MGRIHYDMETEGLYSNAVLRPISRGAIRARKEAVKASSWEAVETIVDNETPVPQKVAVLDLKEDGTFWASCDMDSQGLKAESGPFTTSGIWRSYRSGVRLILEELPSLDLPECSVEFSLRQGCLVADCSGLPDGLIQEYTQVCDDDSTKNLAVEDSEQVAAGQPSAGPETNAAVKGIILEDDPDSDADWSDLELPTPELRADAVASRGEPEAEAEARAALAMALASEAFRPAQLQVQVQVQAVPQGVGTSLPIPGGEPDPLQPAEDEYSDDFEDDDGGAEDLNDE